jgi:hypothetical protein
VGVRLLAVLVVLVCAAPAAASPHAKVLVVGTDGTNWDTLSGLMASGRAPALRSLAASGISGPTLLEYAPPFGAFTVSQVGWTTIASGVWPAKHGVTDPSNASPGQRTKNGWADVLSRVEAASPASRTFLAASWGNIGLEESGGPIFPVADEKVVSSAHSTAEYDALDQRSADAAAAALTGADAPDAAFVYFGVVDEAGHEHQPSSAQYTAAVERTDRRVGQLLEAIAARPTRPREQWTIIVTTDHGQIDGPNAHGGPTARERTSFVIASGPGVGSPAAPRVVDIAPTVLHQLGLPVPAGLDGRSFVTAPPPDPPRDPTARCAQSRRRTLTCRIRRGVGAPPLVRARLVLPKSLWLRGIRASADGRRLDLVLRGRIATVTVDHADAILVRARSAGVSRGGVRMDLTDAGTSVKRLRVAVR